MVEIGSFSITEDDVPDGWTVSEKDPWTVKIRKNIDAEEWNPTIEVFLRPEDMSKNYEISILGMYSKNFDDVKRLYEKPPEISLIRELIDEIDEIHGKN